MADNRLSILAYCTELMASDKSGIYKKYIDSADKQFRASTICLHTTLKKYFNHIVYVQICDLLPDGVFSKYYVLIEDECKNELTFKEVCENVNPSVAINRRKDEFFEKVDATSISYPVYNSYQIAQLGNKKNCLEVFASYMPKSCLAADDTAIIRLFPSGSKVVIKPLRENGGKGVECMAVDDVASHLQLHNRHNYIIQEFVETKRGVNKIVNGRHDVRLYVIDGIICLMAVRQPVKGGFLANTANGGSIKFYNSDMIPKDLKVLAQSITKKITNVNSHYFVSLDFFMSSSGWKLIEVNDQPGVPAPYQTNQAAQLIQLIAISVHSYATLMADMQKNKTLNITTRLLVEKAQQKGYATTLCESAPSSDSVMVYCSKPGVSFSFKSLYTDLTPSYGLFAAEDKVLTYNLLMAHHVHTPESFVLSKNISEKEAHTFLEKYKKIVVKPVDSNHGNGISIGVTSSKQMKKAIAHAKKFCVKQPDVLLQQQVEGNEYRFLVLNNNVIAVATRIPANVLGDGISTVEELIRKKNRDPRRGIGHKAELTRINIEDVRYHNTDGFLQHVPKKNERCFVLQTSNLSQGGESIDVTDIVSEQLKELAVRAAKATFLGVAGVDIITNDVRSTDIAESYVIEVNVCPGIRMHQFPAEGKPRDVAEELFGALEHVALERMKANKIIGVSAFVDFIGYKNLKQIPARIDSGARTSSLWASDIQVKNNTVTFKLFGAGSKWYTGKVIRRPIVGTREVTSSTGHEQQRLVVNLSIRMHGKRLNAKFTLSDRSTQSYPILIGRNTLRGNFLVDSADPGDAMMYKYPEEEAEFKESEAI